MKVDNYIALVEAAGSFGAFLAIAVQIHEGTKQTKLLATQVRENAQQTKILAEQVRGNTKQQELQSFLEIYEINRKLISQGFWHPQLFAVLRDAEGIDRETESRCLQQWFNFFAVSQSHIDESVFKKGRKESLIRDLSNFISMKNARRYWNEQGTFYPDSFQELVNHIIRHGESPHPARRLS